MLVDVGAGSSPRRVALDAIEFPEAMAFDFRRAKKHVVALDPAPLILQQPHKWQRDQRFLPLEPIHLVMVRAGGHDDLKLVTAALGRRLPRDFGRAMLRRRDLSPDANPILVAAPLQVVGLALVFQVDVVKVAQHRFRASHLRHAAVIGSPPTLVLLLVARPARLRGDIAAFGRARRDDLGQVLRLAGRLKGLGVPDHGPPAEHRHADQGQALDPRLIAFQAFAQQKQRAQQHRGDEREFKHANDPNRGPPRQGEKKAPM